MISFRISFDYVFGIVVYVILVDGLAALLFDIII